MPCKSLRAWPVVNSSSIPCGSQAMLRHEGIELFSFETSLFAFGRKEERKKEREKKKQERGKVNVDFSLSI